MDLRSWYIKIYSGKRTCSENTFNCISLANLWIYLSRCPCKNNKFYGLAFLFAPAIFLLGLSVIVYSQSRSVMMACLRYNDYKTKCNYFLSSLVHFFQPLLAPVTWTVLGMLRGDYYVCIREGPREACSSDEEKVRKYSLIDNIFIFTFNITW